MSSNRHRLRGLFAVTCLFAGGMLNVSAQPQSAAATAQPLIDPLVMTKKADAFLATLTPPVSVEKLGSGNDLLLDFPAIAPAGPVLVRVMSIIPRTDRMWLLSLSPQPEGPTALLASVHLEPSALPDASLLLDLQRTQSILFVVRAGGKYYGLHRQIKVGQVDAQQRKK